MNKDLHAHVTLTIGMVVLTLLFGLLRRRHPKLKTGHWMLALGCTVGVQLAWLIPQLRGGHALTIELTLISGLALSAPDAMRAGRSRDLTSSQFWLYALPLLALETLFGLYSERRSLYLCVLLCAVLLPAINGLGGRLSPREATWRVAFYGLLLGLGFASLFRWVAYLALAEVFAVAAVRLWQRLPVHSVGRWAMVISTMVLSGCFGLHPWVLFRPNLYEGSELIWTSQKFLLGVGMLVVLLEDQVSSVAWLALHDPLTGISNRRGLMEQMDRRLVRARQRGEQVLVMLIDLDGFKAVNDTHGHEAGDALLQTIAARLQRLLKEDAVVARIGGDEFVLVHGGAQNWLERQVRNALREPMILGTQRFEVDGSLGVATYPEDLYGLNPAEVGKVSSALLRVADRRMYAEKHTARGVEQPSAPLERSFAEGDRSWRNG